jgi:Tfp pilus assembly protein PilF
MRLLFTTAASPLGLAWPFLADEQIVCGPLHLDLDLGGQIFSRRTSQGDYDLAAVIAALPADQRPDMVACVADGVTASWPRNLAACPEPRLLLIGDAQNSPDGLARLLAYARSEPFDRIVFTQGCLDEPAFVAAGFTDVFWFPGLLCGVNDTWLPIVRQAERVPKVLSARADTAPRSALNLSLGALARAGLTPDFWVAHSETRLEQLGHALIALAPSEHGEWPAIFFETLAAGGLLVTGGLGARAGLERLWPEGPPCVIVDEPQALATRLAAWLDAPATVAALRAAGAAWYDRFLGAAPRRAAFVALAREGRPAVPPASVFEMKKPACSAPPALPPKRSDGSAVHALQTAWAAVEVGDYSQALAIAREETTARPESVDGHLILAELFAETGAAAGFERHHAILQRLAPNDPRLLALLRRRAQGVSLVAARQTQHGWMLHAAGRSDEALALIAPLAAKVPSWLPLQVLHAHLLTAGGQSDLAVVAWYRAARHHPNEDELWFNLGLALWRAGRRAESGFALRRAADHAPHVEAHRRAFARACAEEPSIPVYAGRQRNLVVTSSENCQKHGAGVLIKRCFATHLDTVTLRPATYYEGVEEVGGTHLCVPFQELAPAELRTRLRRLLAPYEIRRMVCVPFHREECLYALAAHEVTGARLCTYVMDDRNVLIADTEDSLLRDLFARSSLRLAISSELQMAYMIKYDFDFEVMPPIVTDRAAQRRNCWTPKMRPATHAVLVGNIWTVGQLKQLVKFVARSGLKLDWFGRVATDELSAEGIHGQGFVPENVLADRLTEYPFVIVPSGMLDGSEDNEWLTRLSLPSRIVFLLQTQTPVLVLGHKDTCAGRHVAHLGIGRVMSYNHPDPAQLVREMTVPAARAVFMENAARAADGFVMPEAGRWLWESLDAGHAQPAPFHAFMDGAPEIEILWPAAEAGRIFIGHSEPVTSEVR